MPRGTKQTYPKEIREAFLEAVFRDGLPYTRVAKMLNAGELGDFGKVPVSASTCRDWRDRYERDLAANMSPDLKTWQAIANDALRVLARESAKLKRDARSPKPLDSKRVRDHIDAIKAAKPLAQPAASETPADSQGEGDDPRPPTLLEKLALETSSAADQTPAPQTIEEAPAQPMVAQAEDRSEHEEEMASRVIAHASTQGHVA